MGIRAKLHNVIAVYPQRKGALELEAAAGAEPADSQGVFITPQSLVTFPVASAAVTLIWKALGAIFPALAASKVTLLIIGFLIGALIYFISITEYGTARDKMIGLFIAVVNSFLLIASALGIESTV